MTNGAAGSEFSPDDPIMIGVVGKPHGIRGGFYLDGAIDAPALRPGFAVTLNSKPYEIVSRGGTDARPILSVAGVEDRDAAQALRGAQMTAPRATLTPLGEGEWYAQDLAGLRVATGDGAELGTVSRLTNAPSVDFLEVARPGGEQLLVPMLRDAIVRIDVEAGEVIVDGKFLDLG